MVLVAQWCQPCQDVQAEDIAAKLNHLAERVLEHLLPSHPDLSIFKKIREQQKEQVHIVPTQLPSLGELRESAWPSEECRLLLTATNHIMYQQEEFSGNSDDYYNPNNSYINKVLEKKQGIPITLCLLYSCVLKRLGVILTPVNFPGHFLLRCCKFLHLKLISNISSSWAGGTLILRKEARPDLPTSTPLREAAR